MFVPTSLTDLATYRYAMVTDFNIGLARAFIYGSIFRQPLRHSLDKLMLHGSQGIAIQKITYSILCDCDWLKAPLRHTPPRQGFMTLNFFHSNCKQI